jgi:NAD+ diphosphatase
MHEPINMDIFSYCPSCGSKGILFDGMKKLRCRACSFTYFHNTAAATGVILEYGQQIVLLRRSREPAKGKLDLPGGFIDPDETAEEALRREIREELNMELGTVKYIGSYPNTYEYKGVTYKTCDLYFSSRIDTLPTVVDKSEIEELILIHPCDVPDDQIAFESIRTWLRLLKRGIE